MADEQSETESADIIVIGMGPAGESVAGQLAEAGLDVVGIEAELVGGECPYWGCVPSKMMIRAAHLLAEARRIPGMAGKVEVTPTSGDLDVADRVVVGLEGGSFADNDPEAEPNTDRDVEPDGGSEPEPGTEDDG